MSNLSSQKNLVKTIVKDVVSNYELNSSTVVERMKCFGRIQHEDVPLIENKGINDVVQKILLKYENSFSKNNLAEELNRPSAKKTYNNTFEYLSYYAEIQVFNNLLLDLFLNTEKKDRAILLPHCLRPRMDCKAQEYNDLYEKCSECNNCEVSSGIVAIARENNYDTNRIAIAGGGEEVVKIISSINPSGVVGIACIEDLRKFMYFYAKGSRDNVELPPSQMILLSSTGCKNTYFDTEDVKEVLGLKLK